MRYARIVVNHHPAKGQEQDSMYFGHRVRLDCSAPKAQDARKAINALAKGKKIWDMWERVPAGINVKLYSVFKGLFEKGVYKGRASTYHYWRIQVDK